MQGSLEDSALHPGRVTWSLIWANMRIHFTGGAVVWKDPHFISTARTYWVPTTCRALGGREEHVVLPGSTGYCGAVSSSIGESSGCSGGLSHQFKSQLSHFLAMEHWANQLMGKEV